MALKTKYLGLTQVHNVKIADDASLQKGYDGTFHR